MDIQHITALIEMLSSLGFPASANRQLLFYACLRQKHFVIGVCMCFGEDTVNYQLHFKEDNASKKLLCYYYDATLRKAVEIAATVINGVDVPDLENRMAAVNWQIPSENDSADNLQIADKTSWMQEATIEEIIADLEVLVSTEEGASSANALKYKFWIDTALQNMVPELVSLKSRYELTQRFYVINGDGITTKEAYRFLNNRWMERKIHTSKRLLSQIQIEQKENNKVIRGTSDRKKHRHSPKASSGK